MNHDSFFDAFDNPELKSGNYFVLVIYDISDSKRRVKLSKLLERYGVRVQESAFECFLSKGEIEGLMESILKVIDVSSDSLRLYRLNRKDSVEIRGVSPVTRERFFVVV